MAYRIRRVEYFHATVVDEPGEAYKVLSALAGLGVDLVAFTAVPVGPDRTQLTVFPEDPGKLKSEAQKAGMALDGPHRALLVRRDRAGRGVRPGQTGALPLVGCRASHVARAAQWIESRRRQEVAS